MLELRPNCEWYDKDLPPDLSDARICSYECTYCAECVANVVHDVCTTVVVDSFRTLGLKNQPASVVRICSNWMRDQIDDLSSRLPDLPPALRLGQDQHLASFIAPAYREEDV